jgi:hypothetical protein
MHTTLAMYRAFMHWSFGACTRPAMCACTPRLPSIGRLCIARHLPHASIGRRLMSALHMLGLGLPGCRLHILPSQCSMGFRRDCVGGGLGAFEGHPAAVSPAAGGLECARRCGARLTRR